MDEIEKSKLPAQKKIIKSSDKSPYKKEGVELHASNNQPSSGNSGDIVDLSDAYFSILDKGKNVNLTPKEMRFFLDELKKIPDEEIVAFQKEQKNDNDSDGLDSLLNDLIQ